MCLEDWQNSWMHALSKRGEDQVIKKMLLEDNKDYVSIYKNNVKQSLVSALFKTYPICVEILGEEYFRKTAKQYVAGHPMVSQSLNDYGDSFAVFLQEKINNKVINGFEYIADLALLEFNLHQSYYASDSMTGFSIDMLKNLSDIECEEIVLLLNNDVFILESIFPLYEIWLRYKEKKECVVIKKPLNKYYFCIYRSNYQAVVETIDKSDYYLLKAIEEKLKLKYIIEIGFSLEKLPEFVKNGWMLNYEVNQ